MPQDITDELVAPNRLIVAAKGGTTVSISTNNVNKAGTTKLPGRDTSGVSTLKQ